MGRGMYALSNRPSKIVASSRIGPPNPLNNLEYRDTEKRGAAVGMSSPKPVFNGKKSFNRPNQIQQEPTTQQHEEMVRFLHDGWTRVEHEVDNYQRSQRVGGPVVYREKAPNPKLNDFKAFDLEEFWRTKFLQSTGIK